ncbi:MAG: ketoacyl-ACP synthase III [Oscillospiraceae bacterium]|jgi:3-oxoacyl-[acyl-carrier-protein] synthase-3|nr:ketoacyl-ACP synthase III [Oscillospiraceae bacterium]
MKKMNPKNKNGVKITGTGSYAPPLSVSNDDLAKILDTTDEWVYTRTGIRHRYFNEGRPNYTMAVEAAKNALENAGITAEDIDYIMLSTCTPDFFYPITACLVQNETGALNAACIDINAACTGFVAGLEMARGLLYSGYDRILFIASECLTPQVDFYDRATSVLFGDGAGAVVLERADKTFASVMKAKGVSADEPILYYKIDYEANTPFGGKTPDYAKKLQMGGKDVYKFAVEAMPEAAKAACEKAGFALDEIDLFIPHQANIRIVQTAVKSLGVSMEKVYTNIENHGNTSSACMPVCLDELNRAGRLKEGMKLCLVGFGAGLTYGAIVMEI